MKRISGIGSIIITMALLVLFHSSCTDENETDTINPSPTATATPAVTPTPIPTAIEYNYCIENIYPHDPSAFTQGLVYIDDYLYEETGLYGESSLRKVELETGEIVQNLDLDNMYFGEGITVLEDKIYQLTYLEKVAFVYDRESFNQLGQFSYQTQGWGLTHDGSSLIMSDGSSTLYFRDPGTFEVISTIDVYYGNNRLNYLNELEFINGEIYANVWLTDYIVRIDAETGYVNGVIDLSGLLDAIDYSGNVDVLNGIAWDASEDRLFVTGKWWPALFEITLVPAD